MQKELFYTALSHPFSLSEQEQELMEQIVKEYPFFQAAQLMRLQNAYGDEKYERMLQNAGIHIPEPKYYYKRLMFNKMYSNLEVVFKAKKGENTRQTVAAEEAKELTAKGEKQEEALQYAPSFYKIEEIASEKAIDFDKETHDFTDWLNALEHPPKLELQEKIPEKAQKTAETISLFMNSDKKVASIDSKTKELTTAKKEYDPEQLMSQTLAEIYVKQRLYDKAIAIYKKLDLKSSEKNTTFVRRIEEINELKKI